MTFEQWVASKDFWKRDAGESFWPIWEALDEKGYPSAEIAGMLDSIVSAMQSEYGH